jgi:hypothetical protein
MYLCLGQSEKGRERERESESDRQKVSRYMVCKPDIPYSITQDVLQVFDIKSLLYTVLRIIQVSAKKIGAIWFVMVESKYVVSE